MTLAASVIKPLAKLKIPELGTAQLWWRGTGDHGRQQSLGHAHVQAPQGNAGEYQAPGLGAGQHQIRANQDDKTGNQESGVAHAVR